MVDYYKKAIEIIKQSGDPTLEKVMGSLFPATDFPVREIKKAKQAIKKAQSDCYVAAVKYHPRWNNAVLSGRSPSECLKLWREEGGNSFLQKL